MKVEKCKICGGECAFNPDFTRFLALSETECDVRTCGECGTAFLSGDIPGGIYTDEYFSISGTEYDYEEQSVSNKKLYEEIVQELVHYAPGTDKLADIGCGMGHFLREAGRNFDRAEGFDGFSRPDRFVANPASLFIQDIDDLELLSDAYDAITLNHSLEHVEDPLGLLKNIFLALKDGGVVYVEVPYQFGSLYDRVQFAVNPKIRPDFLSFHHKTFFCPRSLRLALERSGFSVLKVRTFLPSRGVGRFKGLKGKLLFCFLWFSSVFHKGDYISIIAKKNP